MTEIVERSRRRFLQIAGTGGLLTAGGLIAPAIATAQEKKEEGGKEEVTPPEDLMREHGVLDRVLLIYEAAIRKLRRNEDFDPAVVTDSAGIVRDFIENYHEKSEEQHVFPRFKQAGQMVALVDVLLAQHQAGRQVTAEILKSAPNARTDEAAKRQVIRGMRVFINMYRPHAAREDTDLFPKLRSVVSGNEYDAMAEDFEKQEHQLFGEDGFEKMVARVAQLEQTIGIADLSQFTPRAQPPRGPRLR
jgi:hemerythrin-like domain-containing protein